MVKYQPTYEVGAKVEYNSLLCAGAAMGTIKEVDNSSLPHVYTIEPDLFQGKSDTVEEQHIFKKL